MLHSAASMALNVLVDHEASFRRHTLAQVKPTESNEANPAPRDGVSGLTSIRAPRAAGNVPREIQ